MIVPPPFPLAGRRRVTSIFQGWGSVVRCFCRSEPSFFEDAVRSFSSFSVGGLSFFFANESWARVLRGFSLGLGRFSPVSGCRRTRTAAFSTFLILFIDLGSPPEHVPLSPPPWSIFFFSPYFGRPLCGFEGGWFFFSFPLS